MKRSVKWEGRGSCSNLLPPVPALSLVVACAPCWKQPGSSDILTKSLGSSNFLNVVLATMDALEQLKSPQEEAARRGKSPKEVTPFWERRQK